MSMWISGESWKNENSDSEGLGWGLSFCIPNTVSDGAQAADPRTHLSIMDGIKQLQQLNEEIQSKSSKIITYLK